MILQKQKKLKNWNLYNIYNFDYAIIKALEEAEKDGNLIDEC